MCEFLSWKEVECPDGSKQILFLIADDVFNTSRGRKLRRHTTPDDFIGHGAIDFYYQLAGKGRNKECADFTTPANFPPEIIVAIKQGLFAKLAPVPYGLLCKSLDDDYEAKRKPLYDDYEAKRESLDDDYEAKRESLYDDYEAKRKSLYDDYKAKRKPLDDDYEAKRKPLDDDYEAKRKPLDDDYWQLVRDPANRAEAWR